MPFKDDKDLAVLHNLILKESEFNSQPAERFFNYRYNLTT